MTEGAGKYAFAWIYSKYSLEGDDMNAEIEYIMFQQQGTTALECLPCKLG
jgi:hypothetical protein